MSCCGKTKKLKSIVQGYARGQTPESCRRIKVCHTCDNKTWLSKKDIWEYFKTQKLDVIKKLDELEQLPKLPKKEKSKTNRFLFCRICKCYIPAKAKSDEKCPLNKWGAT